MAFVISDQIFPFLQAEDNDDSAVCGLNLNKVFFLVYVLYERIFISDIVKAGSDHLNGRVRQFCGEYEFREQLGIKSWTRQKGQKCPNNNNHQDKYGSPVHLHRIAFF